MFGSFQGFFDAWRRRKELEGFHDWLHMFHKLQIVNHNYHPIETLIVSADLFAITAILSCIGRAKFLQLNAYLKTLRISSITIYAAVFAATTQAFGLDRFTHKNHWISEEILEPLLHYAFQAQYLN